MFTKRRSIRGISTVDRTKTIWPLRFLPRSIIITSQVPELFIPVMFKVDLSRVTAVAGGVVELYWNSIIVQHHITIFWWLKMKSIDNKINLNLNH